MIYELSRIQKDFARNWALNPTNPLQAAINLRLDNGEKVNFQDAIKFSESWVNELAVIAERKRCVKNGVVRDALPTKDEFLLVLWERMSQRISNDEFVKMGKLFADVSQYIDSGKQPVAGFGQSHENINERIDQLLKRRSDRVM